MPKELPSCRFVVRAVAAERNLRGTEMRRVHLMPVESRMLQADGDDPPPPDAGISLLLNPDAAKPFQVGDEFDVAFREVK